MKVRALTAIVIGQESGPVSYGYGERFDLPDHEAEAHIAAGHAEAVQAEVVPAAKPPQKPVPETATVPPKGEQATRFAKRGR